MKILLVFIVFACVGAVLYFVRREGIRKFLKVIATSVFVVIISVIVLNQMMNLVVKSKKEVMVPNLVGKSLNEALDILSKQELYLKKVGEQYSEKIPSGCIISQEPSPAFMVKQGRVIKVIVSSGGQMVFVPDLVGRPVREAKILIRQAGLALGAETGAYSAEVKKDFVIAQEPLADEIVARGTSVDLVVSLGPPEEGEVRTMVNLLGQNIRTARKVLQDIGLSIEEISEMVDDTVPEGTILKQEPPAGDIIDEGTKVKLTIARRTQLSKIIREAKIYYEVSQGVLEKDIKIVIIDGQGEREVYHKMHSPGSKIILPVQVLGRARARVFVNGILAREMEL